MCFIIFFFYKLTKSSGSLKKNCFFSFFPSCFELDVIKTRLKHNHAEPTVGTFCDVKQLLRFWLLWQRWQEMLLYTCAYDWSGFIFIPFLPFFHIAH